MNSKVSIDLDFSNGPVVLLKLATSEDVRDKIANRFKANFDQRSNLAIVRFLSKLDDFPVEVTTLEIAPMRGTFEEVKEQLWSVSEEQMSMLIRNFSICLAQREVGIDWDYLKKEYDEIRKEFSEKLSPPAPSN